MAVLGYKSLYMPCVCPCPGCTCVQLVHVWCVVVFGDTPERRADLGELPANREQLGGVAVS